MHQLEAPTAASKQAMYRTLKAQLAALFAKERDGIANSANAASVLFHQLPDLNWVGFYFLKGNELVLGPFQGQAACVRIALGAGVCGTAAAQRVSVVVPDVHAFAGHIACDPASRSEIVVPLVDAGRLLGVLDLDSPSDARFDEEDRTGLEALAALLVSCSDLDRCTA